MINELDALERKIALVIGMCEALRAENAQLRQQLAVSENECSSLTERMSDARGRIEQLALQLPESPASDRT